MSAERRIWWHARNEAAEEAADRLTEALRRIVGEHLVLDDSAQQTQLLRGLERAAHQAMRRAVPWRAGQAWLHFPSPWRSSGCIGVEWHAGGKSCGVHLTIAGQLSDDDFSAGLRIPLIGSLWVSVAGLLPYAWRPRSDRRFGVSIHDGSVWWELLSSDDWDSRAPFWKSSSRWRQPHWHVVDWLLGRAEYSERALSTHQGVIIMPEGAYGVHVALSESTWTRARWPKRTTTPRAKIALLQPIPVPGKGENSWDCGEDAIYSLTTTAATFDEAMAALSDAVMRARER